MKTGDRVRFKDKPFLSDGYIKRVVNSFACKFYIVKLDQKAPNEYAYSTDEVVAFPDELEPIPCSPAQ